jgi:hypothetical protein
LITLCIFLHWKNKRRQFNHLSICTADVRIADEKYCADGHAKIQDGSKQEGY